MIRSSCVFPAIFSALLACGALDFDITQNLPETTIRGDPVAATAGTFLATDGVFNPFTLNINLEQETKARGTSLASSVKLKSMFLELTATSAEPNFDWLQTLDVFVESTKSGTTLPKRKIAALPTASRLGAWRLTLVVENVNLLQYVQEGTRLTATASAKAPARDAVFGGQVIFRVGVL